MHRRANVAIAAVAVLGLGGVVAQEATASSATSHAASTTPAAKSKADATRDGRALFEGLTFAQGPVAEKLAHSGKFVDVAALRKKNSTADQRKAVTAVLDGIQKQRPDFFSSFSAKLRSGDPRQVKGGIAEAADILKSLSTTKVKNIGTGAGTGECVNVVAAVNILVAVNLGGVANVSVAVNAQASKWVVNTSHFWSSFERGQSSLNRDEEIAQLTQVLAG
ncbi:hypothetical protein I5Q34_30970 [Streptomyces sp. AV19]|uniref:hypothetical protein n=1 Tax=Streptomyces sp. AV19 TaxID=2793068 RepID=UPI0018FEFE4B|nr:hypothetical protein [Streptomyces sp. AV19]MBH1938631.1 hypothetical protein [Streptomyces sp. AV19]MDG4535343.1 hypothetical protein [Streptomyces sp. AV19]